MSDDFAALEAELARMAQALAPPARAKLASTIAAELRKANAKRIRANVAPDGSAMPPRKSAGMLRPRSLRAAAKKASRKPPRMFQKAGAWLTGKGTPDGAELTFRGAAERIMTVHQFGLVDRVSPETSAEVAYPERIVLGFSEEDRTRLFEKIAQAIAGEA